MSEFPDFTAHLGLLLVDLYIPESGSLKGKRKYVKSIKDKIRARFNASVAEVGAQGKWQRVVLAASMVGNDKARLDSKLQHVRTLIEEAPGVTLLQANLEFL